jgi:carbonic anhydrase
MITQTKDTQNKMTHERALAMLKKGNARYLQNTMINRDLREQVETTGFDGQAPHSVILSCIDSRVTSEYIFDQGIGDIFSARVAGNFVNTDILGSMEFAVINAGVKLIVVLGHTACGAVKGTCDFLYHKPQPKFTKNLIEMAGNIVPAAQAVANEQPDVDHTSANSKFIQDVSDLNVKNAMENIMKNSPALAKEIKDGDVALIGAMYDVKSGEVTWM